MVEFNKAFYNQQKKDNFSSIKKIANASDFYDPDRLLRDYSRDNISENDIEHSGSASDHELEMIEVLLEQNNPKKPIR